MPGRGGLLAVGAECFPGLQRVVGQIPREEKSLPRAGRLKELQGSRRSSKPTPAPSRATGLSPNRWEPPAAGPRLNGPRSPRGCSDARCLSHPGVLWANAAPQPLPLHAFALLPPFAGVFPLAGSGGVAEHQESQRRALIRGCCQCRASSTLLAQQSRSLLPFLLCREVAAGDVEPLYESLQLGLLCCLPRLISFNYLSPFFSLLSLSQILGFFQVMIFFLSAKLRLPLPVCLQLPSLLPTPSLSPLLFSTRSSLHAALPPAPPALCLPASFLLLFFSIFLIRWLLPFSVPTPALLPAVLTAGPGDAGVPACPRDVALPHHGLFYPSSTKPGAALTMQEASPGRWHLLLPRRRQQRQRQEEAGAALGVFQGLTCSSHAQPCCLARFCQSWSSMWPSPLFV